MNTFVLHVYCGVCEEHTSLSVTTMLEFFLEKMHMSSFRIHNNLMKIPSFFFAYKVILCKMIALGRTYICTHEVEAKLQSKVFT